MANAVERRVMALAEPLCAAQGAELVAKAGPGLDALLVY